MPETQGEGSASLEAKVIRADGTEEDLGVIAMSSRRFICDSDAAWVEFDEGASLPPIPSAFLQRGATLTVHGPYAVIVTEGTIHELTEEGD
jgi:hypothetical protein